MRPGQLLAGKRGLVMGVANEKSIAWGIAAAAAAQGAEIAFSVYGLHMILNFAWSPIFFGLRRIDWAFFEIILFWVTLVATILLF